MAHNDLNQDQNQEPAASGAGQQDVFDIDAEEFQRRLEGGEIPSKDESRDQRGLTDGGQGGSDDTNLETPGQAPKEDGFFEKNIIHNGQEIHLKLTDEEHRNLLQKGYNHDYVIGRYKKIAQLLDADPGAQEALNSYINKKYNMGLGDHGKPSEDAQEPFKFEVKKKLSEYDDENQWALDILKDNLEPYVKHALDRKMKSIAERSRPSQMEQTNNVASVLSRHDPDNFSRVSPMLQQEFFNLPMNQALHIQGEFSKGNWAPFLGFYNSVKEKAVGTPGKSSGTGNKPASTFRVKSGGGQPPRQQQKSGDLPDAWEVPDKEFREMMDKIKGY